jgi:high affinity Mn2+ porin
MPLLLSISQHRSASALTSRILIVVVLALAGCVSDAAAQEPASEPPSRATIFPHSDHTWWWLSGQVNIIEQAHATFTSPYEGENSLRASAEHAMSRVWTIYTGAQIGPRTELLFDIESAGGRGMSDALGLSGFTNLDVVRNPTLGSRPYLARLMIHHTIALSRDTTPAARTALSLATEQPSRRLELRAGKLGIVDFFDLNASGSDSHLQFTNWTIDNNGAYDYAADTRGYTYAAMVEYDSPRWALRFTEALMPTVANGITFDWDVARARAENPELEIHPARGLVTRH